jgi:hypothetical protein
MDISNFQLDSVIGHRTENPCVSGSGPFAPDRDIGYTFGGSALGATRSRNFDCDPLRSPCVLPQVPYRDMRRRQRRGVKLSGQRNLNRERLAAESREEAATASRKAVGG